ncbi:hypothetical protein LXA43DRAFT_977776 [Ganoderma leucocontextum]|nr:hypothetical protein LXA43DRAFT_977776 [Ganoderma leucocontextum]
MDVDDEDQPAGKKRGSKPQIRRADVAAARAHEEASSGPKRKAPPAAAETAGLDGGSDHPKKPKPAVVKGGIHRAWQDWFEKPKQTVRPNLQVSRDGTPSRPAKSTAPTPRNLQPSSAHPSPPGSRAPKSHTPDSAAQLVVSEHEGLCEYAGLQDEDETRERDALNDEPDAGALVWRDTEDEDDDGEELIGQDEPVSAIVPRCKDIYTSVRRVPAAEAATAAEGKKKAAPNSRLSGNDLPRDYRDDFTRRLVPFLRAVAGTVKLFSPLDIKEKCKIFKKIFPWSTIQLDQDDVFATVMDNRYSEWKTKFCEAALAVVASEMGVGDRKTSREARIAFCREQLALAPDADRADKSTIKGMHAPFFWEIWRDGQKQGRFEGEMLIKTFAYAHLPVLEAVPQDLRDAIPEIYGDSVPIGALVMAALALEFALHAWLTGKQHLPKGAEGNFSADNWGDRVVKHQGTTIKENKVQLLFKRAGTLDSERILRIIDKARAFVGQRRQAVQKGQVAGDVEEDSEPDFASSD